MDAVGVSTFGVAAFGFDGEVGRLLGPKMSVRVDGKGDIKPVDGMAENSELVCASAEGPAPAAKINARTGASRPHLAAVAKTMFIAPLFSAEIAAISSRDARVCGSVNAVLGATRNFREACNARRP